MSSIGFTEVGSYGLRRSIRVEPWLLLLVPCKTLFPLMTPMAMDPETAEEIGRFRARRSLLPEEDGATP